MAAVKDIRDYEYHSASGNTFIVGLPGPSGSGKSKRAWGYRSPQLPTRMDSRQVTLRGEGREFWSGVPQLNVNTGKSHQYNLFAGGGIVWHF